MAGSDFPFLSDLNPSRAVLLAIDLQRAFCSPDGSVAQQGRDVSACAAAAERCFALVAAARSAAMPVIWTRMMFRADYADGGRLVHDLRPGMKANLALRAGTEDVELLAGADVQPEDFVVDKARFSAFFGTQLDLILRQFNPETLVVGGVTSTMCVESTVRDAGQRDYGIIVADDACADLTPERHAAAMTSIEYGFGRIAPADLIIDALAVRKTSQ